MKPPFAETPPAAFVAVTFCDPFVVAPAVNEYVRDAPEPEPDQFVPSAEPAGNVVEAMSESLSLAFAVTSKEPPEAASGRK